MPANREFTKLWAANAASNLSDGMRLASLPLLAASITRDPLVVGGLFFAQLAPNLFLSVPGGAVVDRVNRKRLLASLHASRAITVAALALAVAAGTASVPLLYAVALLLGSAEVVLDSAATAITPQVVAADRLDRSNGMLEMGTQATNQFIGPALGGVLFAALPVAPFAVDAAVLGTAVAAVAVMRPIPNPKPDSAAQASFRTDMAEGVRWLWRYPLLRSITLLGGTINFSINATLAIFVLFALEVLGLPASRYGLLLTASAVGGIGGGVVGGPVVERLGRTNAIPLVVAVAAAATLVTGLTSSALVVGATEFTIAVCAVVWHVATVTLRQQLTPTHLMGRAAGVHRLIAWGAGALGALAGSAVASAAGLRAPFFVAAACLALVAVSARVVLARHRPAPDQPPLVAPH